MVGNGSSEELLSPNRKWSWQLKLWRGLPLNTKCTDSMDYGFMGLSASQGSFFFRALIFSKIKSAGNFTRYGSKMAPPHCLTREVPLWPGAQTQTGKGPVNGALALLLGVPELHRIITSQPAEKAFLLSQEHFNVFALLIFEPSLSGICTKWTRDVGAGQTILWTVWSHPGKK